jgi:hypothetical protein
MQVFGLEWKQFAITWLHKGVKRSVEELATHLKLIIREEKKLTHPTDPALEMPTWDSNTSNYRKAVTLQRLTRSNLERERQN